MLISFAASVGTPAGLTSAYQKDGELSPAFSWLDISSHESLADALSAALAAPIGGGQKIDIAMYVANNAWGSVPQAMLDGYAAARDELRRQRGVTQTWRVWDYA